MTQPSPVLDFARIGVTGVRLEALFEAVPLAIAIFDGDLRLANANARYREADRCAGVAAVEGLDLRRVPNALSPISPIRSMPRCAARRDRARFASHFNTAGTATVETTPSCYRRLGNRGIPSPQRRQRTRRLRETLQLKRRAARIDLRRHSDSVRVSDTEGRTVRSNTQALQDHPAGQPSTLRELWQLDRPRTIEGRASFMHEHPTARATRRACAWRDARRSSRSRCVGGHHRVNSNPYMTSTERFAEP